MLDAFFQSGTVPIGVKLAFVTPIHKKGSDLDIANYRPVAIGEPLYRLSTIILNKRLVDWSEEHGVCSPARAGFSPRLSTAQHLFALWHFIDRARVPGVPFYACFVDVQKAYDTD